jgi:hypothetical protein
MIAEVNAFGCAPADGQCIAHQDELACSHACSHAKGLLDHLMKCDDPPPPLETAWPGFTDDCIGCGRALRAGDFIRRYEDGTVCGDGCLEKDASS